LGFESAAEATCGAASTGSKAPFLTTLVSSTVGAPAGKALCIATKYNAGTSCTTRNPFALTFKNEYGASFTTRTIECADYDAATYHAATFADNIATRALLAERSATAAHCRGFIESALEDMPNSALVDVDVRDQHKGAYNDPRTDTTDNEINWAITTVWTGGDGAKQHELDVHFVSNTGDVNLITVIGQDTEVVTVQDSRIHHSNQYVQPDVSVTEKSKGTTDNFVCSNRGVCDYSTGTCKCFQGFTRQDCSLQNVLAMY